MNSVPVFWHLFGTFLLITTLSVVATAALILDRIDPRAEAVVMREILLSTAVIIGLSLVPTWYFARKLTRPLGRLTDSARRIARGEYGLSVREESSPEVRILAESFSEMSGRLKIQIGQLEQDRHQLRAILSGMTEGVIAMDGGQVILFANERAAKLLGFEVRGAVGQRFWEFVRQPQLQALLERATAEGEPTKEVLDFFGPGVRSISVYAAPLPMNGSRAGALLVLHDITELRKLERVRQDFIANASHELKTPLSVILTAVEALIDGAVEDPKAGPSLLSLIASQGKRLEALILDMLSLARAESGSLELELRPVSVANAVADCIDRHRQRAAARDQALIAEPPADLRDVGLTFWADEMAVAQILDNLVDNALKYTPEGGRVQIRWQADDDRVVVGVEDNGIGIPERDLARVFERFYRVDKARSKRVGGTGLGLAIVKHFAQALNGEVTVQSRVNHGSTFMVSLPRAKDV